MEVIKLRITRPINSPILGSTGKRQRCRACEAIQGDRPGDEPREDQTSRGQRPQPEPSSLGAGIEDGCYHTSETTGMSAIFFLQSFLRRFWALRAVRAPSGSPHAAPQILAFAKWREVWAASSSPRYRAAGRRPFPLAWFLRGALSSAPRLCPLFHRNASARARRFPVQPVTPLQRGIWAKLLMIACDI